MSHVTRVDESRLTHECGMGPFCCSDDKSGDEGVIPHVRMRHVPRMHESSQRMDESRLTRECGRGLLFSFVEESVFG